MSVVNLIALIAGIVFVILGYIGSGLVPVQAMIGIMMILFSIDGYGRRIG